MTPAGRRRHRSQDRPGRRRGRDRGQLRRAVGQAGRRDVRRDRAAALGRALLRGDRPDRRRALPTCRCCATRTATPTSRKRSAACWSAASSRTPSRGWHLTSCPYPFEFQLLDEDWEHFSILMESAITRIPALAKTGMKKLYNGPESFTPDNQFILGPAPGLRQLLRRRRVQLGRHRLGRRRGQGARRLDRRRRSRQRPVGRRHQAVRRASTATIAGCATGSARCSACTTRPRGRTASWRPPGRSAGRPAYHLLAARWRLLRLEDGLGTGECLRAARAAARLIEYSWDKPNWLPWSVAEQRATRGAVAVFDQTSFSKYLVSGPRAAGGAAVAVHRRRRRAARPHRLHRHAERERPVRGRHHGDAGWRRMSSCCSAVRHRPSATWTTSAGGCQPAASAWST